MIEQARTDVLGYQAENKGGDLDKTQLKNVLDKYFDEVPDLTDMEKDAILHTELNTLAKYGTHTIAVYEIYNGNIKSNNVQTMISFKIKIWEPSTGYRDTYQIQCVQGMTWSQWANSNSEPIYNPYLMGEGWCGHFHGSLQELVLSLSDGDHIEHEMDDYYTLLQLEERVKAKIFRYYS
ncbi:MAG: hypothetical protein IJK18_07260 [Clostridia bacterium]|nr:hypothetical protein [Clostridia bacterium]